LATVVAQRRCGLCDGPRQTNVVILLADDVGYGDIALRYDHWFGTNPQFWLNLHRAYEARSAEEKAGREIARLPELTGVTRSHVSRNAESLNPCV